ncbi:hypothetical protein [Rosistilla oblonga]|uniref:hypothetical protein n=1 Tax=Rosistilla oblonga TaxID=2527990 RepID=UPI003A97295E
MGLWGYSTEQLAAEVKRRAFQLPLPRDHSPDVGWPTHATFIRIPVDGIEGATNGGATPSITSCVKYDPIGPGGELVKSIDADGDVVKIDVRHYGAPIAGRNDHEFQYMQAVRFRGGWCISVEYCDGDGSGTAAEMAVVGSSAVGTATL